MTCEHLQLYTLMGFSSDERCLSVVAYSIRVIIDSVMFGHYRVEAVRAAGGGTLEMKTEFTRVWYCVHAR